MTSQYDTLLGAFAAIVGPIVGQRLGTSLASMAEATPIELSSGVTQLIGPAGALVGLIIALKWMTGRLNRSEDKYEARQRWIEDRETGRQAERDTMLKTLVSLATETKDVIWQNSKAIEEFRDIIKGCPGHNPTQKK